MDSKAILYQGFRDEEIFGGCKGSLIYLDHICQIKQVSHKYSGVNVSL